MAIKANLMRIIQGFNAICEFLKPAGDLLIRYWVAKTFFMSGLLKIQSWSTTIMLFQFEYHVPILNPTFAAILAAFIEIGMSSLLLLGLGGRFPAFFLFLFNIIAVYSYPFLWTQTGAVGLNDHIYWGLLLLILVLHGPGKLSLDQLINWWITKRKALCVEPKK